MQQTVNATATDGPATARWSRADVERLFDEPLLELVYRAQTVHRRHFAPGKVQLSTLLSIKTGGCPEDCAYCPQSARYRTNVADEPIVDVAAVVAAARSARDAGATRFCMGAAWRGPKQRDLEPVLAMVRAVKALGLETCATLGLLRDGQAECLKDSGLDYYNHNLDTAPEAYGRIVSTRHYEDRLDTLDKVRRAGMRVCCGGIVLDVPETLGHPALDLARERVGARRGHRALEPPPRRAAVEPAVHRGAPRLTRARCRASRAARCPRARPGFRW